MSQKKFQIFRSQISDLKTDNVDYLKKPPWKNFFFDIFVIHLSSRYEKRCQMLQRLFSLFQGSKNQLCFVRDCSTIVYKYICFLMHNILRKCFYFVDLTTFYILGQNFVKLLVGFFGKFKMSKRHSEINWPLANRQKKGGNFNGSGVQKAEM